MPIKLPSSSSIAAAGFLATRLMRINWSDIPTTMLIGIVGALVGGLILPKTCR